MPAKSTAKKSAAKKPANQPEPPAAEPAAEPTEEPEPLNRAERRAAARRKGGAPPAPSLPRGKVGRGTQIQTPRQWASRRGGG